MSGVSRASDLIKMTVLLATTGRGYYKNYLTIFKINFFQRDDKNSCSCRPSNYSNGLPNGACYPCAEGC